MRHRWLLLAPGLLVAALLALFIWPRPRQDSDSTATAGDCAPRAAPSSTSTTAALP